MLYLFLKKFSRDTFIEYLTQNFNYETFWLGLLLKKRSFFHSRQLCYIIMIKTLKGQSVKNVYLSVFQSALWTQNGKKMPQVFCIYDS